MAITNLEVKLSRVRGYIRVVDGKTVHVSSYWTKVSKHDATTDLSALVSTHKTYGTHGSTLYEHPTGAAYLVKKQDRFRSVLDRKVALLQEHVGAHAPSVHLGEMGGQVVAAHEWLAGEPALKYRGFDPHELSEKDLLRLSKEQAFDWMISNHDAHPGQFIRTPDGDLVGLDKGQAFRYFGKDKLDPGYHPNSVYGEREPVYNTMNRAHMAGTLKLPDPRTNTELRDYIERLMSIPDEEYRDLLRPYAEAAAEPGFLGGGLRKKNDVEHFLDEAVARKNNLLNDMAEYYDRGV